MQRNIIQLSPSTCVVSLPAKWLRENKLSKGKTIDVIEQEGRLVISSSHKKTLKRKDIDFTKTKNKHLLYTQIEAAYIAGYDEINFYFDTKKKQQKILHVANEVPGMIVAKQTDIHIQFKDITGEHSEEVSVVINRVFNMIIDLLQDSLEAITQKNKEFFTTVKARDYTINSYIAYVQRQVNRFGYTPHAKIGVLTTYLKLIEIVCDVFIEQMQQSKLTKDFLNEVTVLSKIFQELQKTFSHYSLEKMHVLETLREKLSNQELKNLLFDLFESQIQLEM